MLALGSNITAFAMAFSSLAAAVLSCITLASMDASSGMKATAATWFTASAATTIRWAFVASTRHIFGLDFGLKEFDGEETEFQIKAVSGMIGKACNR